MTEPTDHVFYARRQIDLRCVIEQSSSFFDVRLPEMNVVTIKPIDVNLGLRTGNFANKVR